MFDNGYYGGAHIAQFIGMAVWGLLMLVLLVVGLGLAFLLARFLLVATKAAQHYLDKNGVVRTKPAKPAPTGLYSPGRPADEPTSSVVPPTSAPAGAPETVAPDTSSSTANTAVVTPKASTPKAAPSAPVLPPKAATPKAAAPTTGAPKAASTRKSPTATTPIPPVEPPTAASPKPVTKPRTPKSPPPAV